MILSRLAFSASGLEFVLRGPAVEALGWMLMHFVWQGAAAALALAVFLTLARRLSPQARYWAGCATLSLMTLAACATFAWQFARAPSPTIADAALTASPTIARSRDSVERAIAFFDITPRAPANERDVHEAIDASIQFLKDAPTTSARCASVGGEPSGDLVEGAPSSTTRLEILVEQIGRCLPCLVLLWSAGVGLLSLRLASGWKAIRRLRAASWELADAAWGDRFARLRERLRISPAVRLLSSASASVPMVVGWIKPVVLLPAGMLTGLSVAQVEALLVHELAHIRRHDALVNLVQNVVETLFFYHPAVWWVSKQIRNEREHCCDDIAAAACGTLGYAQALASLAELRQTVPGFGLAANGTPLINRIRRLAGVQPSPERSAGWLAIAALVLLGAAIALRPADRSRADRRERASEPSHKDAPSEPADKTPKTVRKVTGRVVDQEGKPIAGARLWWLVHDDSPNRRFRTVAECSSDASGHFQIEATFDRAAPRWTLGQLWVLAQGKNWTVDDAPQMTDRLPAKGPELVIRLKPASDIEFQVNNADGRPVPSAVLENNWGYFNVVRRASCGLEVHPMEPEIPQALRALWRTTADASGSAHLRSLRDVCDIKVSSPEFGTQVIRLPQDERTSKRTIRLRQTGRVEGRVVAADPH
ncbi:MAG TPA: M56 family metallopeptidase [Planctomycetaceae bacterium]|nr:M56 family metallopeptidase [Planctomycetaceae bacterium]